MIQDIMWSLLGGASIIYVVGVGAQKLPAGTARQPYQDGSVILHTTLPGGSQNQLNEGMTLGASVCPERHLVLSCPARVTF